MPKGDPAGYLPSVKKARGKGLRAAPAVPAQHYRAPKK
jgi:hypothetical protein